MLEDDSLQTAMEKTIDFVGESIPILSGDKKFLKCVVSEGSIFQAVIDVQNSVSKIGRLELNLRRLCLLMSIYIVSTSTVFFNSIVFAQQDRFESGLASKDRGHYATALRAWLPMAEAGNAEAQNNVGYMYEEGLGVPQNYLWL